MTGARIVLILALWLAAAGSAAAQDWMVCFQPNSSSITTEGYVAVQAASAYAETRRFSAVIIHAEDATGDRRGSPRTDEIQLELAQQGLSIVRIRVEPEPDVQAPDCFRLSVRENVGPLLWHFYGPYFGAGSDLVSGDWPKSLRFLTAGYTPGSRRYCVEGHADPAEGDPSLGAHRAENAALELVRLGVRWEDIRWRGYGIDRLARPTANGEPESLNRRVFIDVREGCPASFG